MFRVESNNRAFFDWAVAFAMTLGLTACGGGSGGGDNNNNGGSSPSYTIGGTVTGLAGTGLILRNNGGDNLSIVGNGSFVFSVPVAEGAGYNVAVGTQPASPAQLCTVSNGVGTVSSGNVTTVSVSCLSAPSASTLSVAFGIKQLRFNWTAPSGATYYRLFQNPDGASGFTQVGSDIAGTNVTLDVSVFRHNWTNARYRLEACNSVGCTLSNEVDTVGGILSAIGYFKASNPGNLNPGGLGDWFGYSVALSRDGSTLAVGARYEDSNASTVNDPNQGDNVDPNNPSDTDPNFGAVYVFVRSGATWAQQAYIKTAVPAHDRFGSSLALSSNGNTLVVGEIVGGYAHIFTRSGVTWTKQDQVQGSSTDSDGFGYAVSLSGDGNTLAVSANAEQSNATGVNGDESDNSLNEAGAVYVFTRTGGTWTRQAYIKASNTGALDHFGQSVTLSSDGNTLAVGAEGEDSGAVGNEGDNSALGAGAVYVFTRSGTNWSQQAYLKASNAGASDEFGWSVTLSGNGNTLGVGAHYEDSAADAVVDSGAVYVFTRSAGVWTQQAYIKASNADVEDQFGFSVALNDDGNTLAVGAVGERSNATGVNGDSTNNDARDYGAAYVFTRTATTWTQQAYVKASNAKPRNEFGRALSLSGDGESLAVGAYLEKGASAGVGGDQTNPGAANPSGVAVGAAYLY